MRIALVAIGSRGDVQPYLALAQALRAKGHTPVVVTHGPFGDWVQNHGFEFAPIPGDPEAILESEAGNEWQETGPNPWRLLKGLVELGEDLAEELLRSTEAALDDVDGVAWSYLSGVAYFVAKAKGIRAVPAWLAPVTPTTSFVHPAVRSSARRLPGRLRKATYDAASNAAWSMVSTASRKWCEMLGIPPMPWRAPERDIAEGLVPLVYGFSPVVVPRPDDYPDGVQITGYWFMDPVAASLDPELQTFLDSQSQKPVVVGFGSRRTDDPFEVANAVHRLEDELRRPVVFLHGWNESEVEASDRLFVTRAAPHSLLLPQSAAFVNHGGAGSVASGLVAGVPTIVYPTFADQYFWASRVSEIGSGPKPLKSLDSLTERVSSAIVRNTETAAENGEKILAEDGRGVAADVIVDHLAG